MDYKIREASEKRHMLELYRLAEYKTPRVLEYLKSINAEIGHLPCWFDPYIFIGINMEYVTLNIKFLMMVLFIVGMV